MSNPLSSISYTNKDFNSIYPELLELAKKLSSKWDPTVSNESDPGVVLIKTDAIIGDKNNYNIDKNILEAFPETVTQEVNARNMYNQLAYYMPWYRSAATDVTFKYIGEELTSSDEFSIPKYTMVADAKSEFVYTLIEEPVFNKESTVVSAKALEGVIVDLKINGSDIITLANIDNKNRIYLDDYTVAENGVFISNVDTSDKTLWEKVDNLLITPLGTKCYEFGVDPRNEICYIEFPQDIANLIDAGINIKYLVSNGSQGNISAKTLERFYQEDSVELNGESLPMNNETFQLQNVSAAVDGSDPQSISDAYLSYKKTVGTFNTLVTLRDYINAIYSSGIVSNGIVADRTTDIQTAYTIITDDEVNPEQSFQTPIANAYASTIDALSDVSTDYTRDGEPVSLGELLQEAISLYSTYIEEEPKEMNAFDLKLYLLQNSGTIANIDQYEESFNMEDIHFKDSIPTRQVLDYISEQKCVQHDFKEAKPNTPCMYQNSYPLNIKIIATDKLTEAQVNEVKINIIKSLFNVVCSRAQEFGVEPQYDVIYDCIANADERIKTVILDDFEYITYAVYWDSESESFKQIPLNIKEFNTTNIVTTVDDVATLQQYLDVNNNPYWSVTRRNSTQFVYTGATLNSLNLSYIEDTSVSSYDILKFDTNTKKFYVYSKYLKPFQLQILLKSILAGKTPLFIPDSPFTYSVADKEIAEVENDVVSTVSMISPYTTSNALGTTSIPWGTDGSDVSIVTPQLPTTDPGVSADYLLNENENIRLLAPSFVTKRSFSNYIKFILQLKSDSGIIQKLPVSLASTLEVNKNYYMSKADWVKVANNIKLIYNAIYSESEGGTRYTDQLNGWKTAYNKFTGSVLTSSTSDVTSYPSDESSITWKTSPDDSLMCFGQIEEAITMSGGAPLASVSDYDPVYQTLRAVTQGIEPIELFEKVISYSIPAETDYQLKAGESITFFWREEDGDDIPYKYECYRGIDRSDETTTKKSPIIRANFAIQGEAIGTTAFISTLSSQGQILFGDSGYSEISSLYGDNDLSGTKNVDVREMNQVVLDRVNGMYKQQNRIYFITNNIINDNYVLRLSNKGSYTSGNTTYDSYRYTLQDNEFFIYTSKDGSEFEILSAGTLIGIDVVATPNPAETIVYSVPVLSPDKIWTEGISAFYDKTINIPREQTMFCREQQIYSIVGGDKLHLLITDVEAFKEANSGSDSKLYPSDTTYPVPYFCSWLDTYVVGFTLSYTSNGSEINLPKLDIQDDLDCVWVGRSYLNISASEEEAQTIVGVVPDSYSRQKTATQGIIIDNVFYPRNLNSNVENGELDLDTVDGSSVELRTSVFLDKVGGQNVDISYLDGIGDRHPVTLYLSVTEPEYDVAPYHLTDVGTVEVTMGVQGATYERSVAFLGGSDYVLSVTNPSESCKFKLFANDSAQASLSTGEGQNEFLGSGIYYFCLSDDTTTINFAFEGEALGGEKLTISKVLRSTLNEILTTDYSYLLENITPQDVASLLRVYDYKGVFKYDNQPTVDTLIKDPLSATSFFDIDHVANSYTIPRCALRLSDATDSTITIVNNR